MNKRNKLLLIETILVAAMVLAALYRYVVWANTGLGFPFTTLVSYQPGEQLQDFVEELRNSANPYTRGTDECMYPPFIEAAVNLLLVRLLPFSIWHKLIGYLVVCLAAHFAILAAYLRSSSPIETVRRVIVLSFCSYPFLFLLDRANCEFLVFFMVVGIVAAIRKGNWAVANVLTAIAINFKPFTVFLLPLYAAQRRWADLGRTAALGLGFCLLGSMYYNVNPLTTLQQLACTVGPCKASMLYSPHGLMFDCSLFGLLRIAAAYLSHPFTIYSVDRLATAYMPAAALAGLALFAYLAFVETSLWRQVTIIAAAMCLLPPFGFDYRLYYLMLPMLMFANEPVRSRSDWAFCLLFALLMAPKGIVHFTPVTVMDMVVIDPILLTALIALTVWEGFRGKRSSAAAVVAKAAPRKTLTVRRGLAVGAGIVVLAVLTQLLASGSPIVVEMPPMRTPVLSGVRVGVEDLTSVPSPDGKFVVSGRFVNQSAATLLGMRASLAFLDATGGQAGSTYVLFDRLAPSASEPFVKKIDRGPVQSARVLSLEYQP